MAAPKGFLKSAEVYSSNCSMAWADNCSIHLTHQWKVFSRKVFLCKQETILTGIFLRGKRGEKKGVIFKGHLKSLLDRNNSIWNWIFHCKYKLCLAVVLKQTIPNFPIDLNALNWKFWVWRQKCSILWTEKNSEHGVSHATGVLVPGQLLSSHYYPALSVQIMAILNQHFRSVATPAHAR